MRRMSLLLREAMATCFAQKATSFLTLLTIAGMCMAILMTSGRTVGAQRDVLESVDSAGTRSIVVRGSEGSELGTGALGRIAQLDSVEWIAGFSSPVDAVAGPLVSGERVSLREMYAADPGAIGIATTGIDDAAFATERALDLLGFDVATGYVVETDSGVSHPIGGTFEPPSFLEYMDPVVFVSHQVPEDSEEISLLTILVKDPAQVAATTEAIRPLLGVADASKIEISGSEELANLRALIEAQLGNFGRTSIVGVTVLAGLLVFMIQQSLVVMRRRDFGRRRALGARRSIIVGLLIVQTVLTSTVGALFGGLLGWFALSALQSSQPPPLYFLAVAVLSVCVGGVAAVVPAVLASRRDPIRELRVP